MASGIYFIVHRDSMKRYVGQAKDIARRLTVHWRRLSKNEHENKHLQRAYNMYGRDAFFEISTPCSIEDLTEREQYFIDTMWDMCYNINKIADKPPGMRDKKHSDKSKAKMSAAKKGKPSSRKDYKHSDKVKAKMSAAKKGRKYSHAYLISNNIIADRATGMSINALRDKYKTTIDIIKDIIGSA